jgi:hypothetical protein
MPAITSFNADGGVQAWGGKCGRQYQPRLADPEDGPSPLCQGQPSGDGPSRRRQRPWPTGVPQRPPSDGNHRRTGLPGRLRKGHRPCYTTVTETMPSSATARLRPGGIAGLEKPSPSGDGNSGKPKEAGLDCPRFLPPWSRRPTATVATLTNPVLAKNAVFRRMYLQPVPLTCPPFRSWLCGLSWTSVGSRWPSRGPFFPDIGPRDLGPLPCVFAPHRSH